MQSLFQHPSEPTHLDSGFTHRPAWCVLRIGRGHNPSGAAWWPSAFSLSSSHSVAHLPHHRRRRRRQFSATTSRKGRNSQRTVQTYMEVRRTQLSNFVESAVLERGGGTRGQTKRKRVRTIFVRCRWRDLRGTIGQSDDGGGWLLLYYLDRHCVAAP